MHLLTVAPPQEETHASLAEQHKAVADLGLTALTLPLPALLQQACDVVVRTLRLDCSAILRAAPDHDDLLVVAGTGWSDGIVGRAHISRAPGTAVSYVLAHHDPVVFEDLADVRFAAPVLQAHNVVSGMVVAIPEADGTPFGLFGAYSRSRRMLSAGEVNLLQSLANIVAATVARAATFDALSRSERHFRALSEHSRDGIVVLNAEQRVLWSNPGRDRPAGPRDEPASGVDLLSFIHEDDASKVFAALDRLVAVPGAQEQFQFRWHAPDGLRYLDSIATNMLDDPAVRGIVVNTRNVTEWKVAEQQLEARAAEEASLRRLAQRRALQMRRTYDALTVVHDAWQSVGSNLDRDAIAQALLDVSGGLSHVVARGIRLKRGRRLELWRRAGDEQVWRHFQARADVRRARRAAVTSGQPQYLVIEGAAPEDTKFSCCVALVSHGQVIGTLEVIGVGGRLHGSVRNSLESLAHQAGSALLNAQLFGDLQKREKRLEELVRRVLVAQEEERRRIAYEVHDGFAQFATATHQRLQALYWGHQSHSTDVRDELQRIMDIAQESVRDARRIIAGLRPVILDELGLAEAIRAEVDGLTDRGWNARLILGLAPERLPELVETTLFRVAQEALNNVRKHAPASDVLVSLKIADRGIKLEVRDTGPGFNPRSARPFSKAGERVGLAGMRERLRLLDGRLTVRSAPGRGTMVVADVPATTIWPAGQRRPG